MVRLGSHVGGGKNALLEDAKALGDETVQIFTHSPTSWKIIVPKYEEMKGFRDAAKKLNIHPIVSHCSYLINLGTTDPRVFYGSISSVKKEIEMCHIFGCRYFVLHVGKHKGNGVEKGIKRVIKGLNLCKDVLQKFKDVDILLETVAGQGTEIGVRFSELNKILKGVDPSIMNRIGVCIDTCHIFVAGYDIASKQGRERTFKEIKESFGFSKIKCIHVNDAKGECGSHLDRHANIGKGKIGYENLKAFLTDKRLAKKDMPYILETPVTASYGHKDDLKLLRRMFR